MAAIKTIGKISALTAISKIKDGHAADLRATLQRLSDAGGGAISGLGTIHMVRWVIFDNETRLLFATNFDGDVEDYMRDFALKAPQGIDAFWGHCEDYPGAENYEKLRDYILGCAIETTGYYVAYPESTVQDILQAVALKKKVADFINDVG